LSTAVFCELRLGDWYDKGTSVEFAACGGCAFCIALTPSPSPTLWERGAARQRFWSAEASASASGGSCASALHNHSVGAGCRGARWCALRFLPRSSVANRRTLISLKHGAVEPRTRNHAKSPRNCPKFPQNRPFPLDIRAKVCYTMHVIGANPE